ncbi:AraC family transcriptional regulator [Sphaerisporangium aureirubrum]|uniref:Helix-turn-helix domain-containing protein n=1 Tax=Sphaerisporangium aureirubrum TaxID=1544736 RepID=A0ABW1NQ84_9ACTN
MAYGVPVVGLRRLVGGYHGYREVGEAPGTHRGLPSPYLTVIFTLEDPVDVAAHPDPRQGPGRYDTLVGGLHTSPALITHEGRQAGVQLGVSPLAARALFGVPAGELANIDVEAGELLGATAREVYERLNAAADWGARFQVLDEALSRRADPGREVSPEVARAWRVLMGSGGTVGVGELAREVGWSARHLGARFGTEIGLTPKVAARVIRFDRVRRALQARAGKAGGVSGDVLGLADLAVETGYYDQSHLVREFRDFSGCSPTRWLAEEFRNVQATAVPAGAESGA